MSQVVDAAAAVSAAADAATAVTNAGYDNSAVSAAADKAVLCSICCELLTSVSCSFCQFEACDDCMIRYTEVEMRDPIRCMSCRNPFKLEYLMEALERKTVRTRLMPYLANVLFEREKMLLPDTQPDAQIEKQIRLLKTERDEIPTIKKLERMFRKDAIAFESALEIKRQRTAEIRYEIGMLESRSALYTTTPNTAAAGGRDSGGRDSGGRVRPQHVMKCPNDDCRGYVDADTFCCGTCSDKICDRCHVSVSKHRSPVTAAAGDAPNTRKVCNEDDLATKRAIQNDTKPCPKCLTLIFKISGCSQMFCTQCHTAFDWNTLRIEMGVLHNPHYYEYLASVKTSFDIGALENVACGELPNVNIYIARVRHLVTTATSSPPMSRAVANKLVSELSNIYRVLQHIRANIVDQYSNDRVKQNLDLRVNYLLGDIDDDQFRTKLLNREKKRMKLTATRSLLDLVQTILTDQVRQVMYATSFGAIADLVGEFAALKNYFESSSETISRIHGGAMLDVAEVFSEERFRR
jgi:hypothetical protein